MMPNRFEVIIVSLPNSDMERTERVLKENPDKLKYLFIKEGHETLLKDIYDWRGIYVWDGTDKDWERVWAKMKEDVHFYKMCIELK